MKHVWVVSKQMLRRRHGVPKLAGMQESMPCLLSPVASFPHCPEMFSFVIPHSYLTIPSTHVRRPTRLRIGRTRP